MNLWLLAHDEETGKVQVYEIRLRATVERTGRLTDVFGRHEVQVRQVADRDFTDGDVGAAITEVLRLDPDPSRFGEQAWREQQQRLAEQQRGEDQP